MRRHHFAYLRFCALILFSSLCAGVCAQETEGRNMSDAIHQEGADTLFALTDDIDEFFGDVRTYEHKKNDWFRIGTEVRFKAAAPVRIRERLRADLDLKEYAKNLRFFVSGEGGDRYENGKTIDDVNEGNDFITDYEGNTASSGVSYDFYRSRYTLVSLDGGLKFGGGVHPFTQFRASEWIPITERLSFEPTQFFRWIQGEGFGEKTRGDLNYQLTDDSRLRSRTEALWSESSRGVDLLEDLSWLKKYTDRTYAGVAVSLTAYTDPAFTPDVYKVAYRYRQLILDDWVYLEVEPGIEFPNERDYRTTPYIAFRLDAYFERDDLPTDPR